MSGRRRGARTKKPFHKRVAESLIEQLKAGTAPWQRPWNDTVLTLPHNPVSGARYRGINVINLLSADRSDPRWMTYRQAEAAGAQVRKDERGTLVQYWKLEEAQTRKGEDGKPVIGDDGKPEKVKIQLERPRVFYATVFNAEQIDGLSPLQKQTLTWDPIERADNILQRSGADIRHGGNRAFYSPATDRIQLPERVQFTDQAGYYATALHELGHWSGHESRLARDLMHPFASEGYAREELRAEIASMLLGAELGIGHDPGQHAAYVGHWIKALQEDPHEIFRAASAAEDIRSYVLGVEQQQQLGQAKQLEQTTQPLRSLSMSSTESRHYIDVPFADKDAARRAGARWDRQARAWYVPTGVDREALSQWPDRPQQGPEVTEQSRVYLAVPYGERKAARAAGARWDRQRKSWYVDASSALQDVQRWLPTGDEQSPAMDPREEFGRALSDMGLRLGDALPVMDGTEQRAPVEGDRRGERGGFYVAHLDGHPAGYIKNHRTGVEINWKAKGYSLSESERAALQAQAAQKQEERAKQLTRRYEAVAEGARRQLEQLAPLTLPTPYLKDKGLGTQPGLYTDGDGSTVVPAFDVEGKLWTLQRISPDGQKRFEKGGRKSGCFHVVGGQSRLQGAEAIVIAEGYATAATVAELLNRPVVAAFDAGNLEPVATALHERFPETPVVIVADDDRAQQKRSGRNPGKDKAQAAAAAARGRVLAPIFAPGEQDTDPRGFSDFNDLATKSTLGRDGARRQAQFVYHQAIAQARVAYPAQTQQQGRAASRARGPIR